VPLAVLVVDNLNWEEQIEYLGFTPTIYSPNHIALDGHTIEKLQAAGMKVIPWTVNDAKVAGRLIGQGVDGIITDYPKIAAEFKDNL
jgi:glycerophosphoryl diester phosphodiesterase